MTKAQKCGRTIETLKRREVNRAIRMIRMDLEKRPLSEKDASQAVRLNSNTDWRLTDFFSACWFEDKAHPQTSFVLVHRDRGALWQKECIEGEEATCTSLEFVFNQELGPMIFLKDKNKDLSQ